MQRSRQHLYGTARRRDGCCQSSPNDFTRGVLPWNWNKSIESTVTYAAKVTRSGTFGSLLRSHRRTLFYGSTWMRRRNKSPVSLQIRHWKLNIWKYVKRRVNTYFYVGLNRRGRNNHRNTTMFFWDWFVLSDWSILLRGKHMTYIFWANRFHVYVILLRDIAL